MPVVLVAVDIPLVGLVLCLLLWGLSQSGQTFFHNLLSVIFDTIGRVPLLGRVVASGIDKLVHLIVKPISEAALAIEQPVVGFFVGLASAIQSYAFSSYYTAERAYAAFTHLRQVTIPHLIRAALGDVVRAGVATGHAIHATHATLGGSLASLWRYARSVEATAVRALTVSERAIGHAVAGTLPRALPWVSGRVSGAEAATERALRGIRDVRNLLAAGVFAGLVLRALARLGVGNVRCGNLKSMERRLCGAPPDVLEALLGGLTLIIGTVSLIEFARACQTVEGEIADGISSFLRP